MKKITVMHVVGAMNRGGAEVMLMDLFRNIGIGFQFSFLVNYKIKKGITEGDFDVEILKKGGQIYHIPAQWDKGPIAFIKEFKNIFKKNGTPDIMHIHMNSKSGIIALAAKKAGVKTVIVHSHADLKFRGSTLSNIISNLELNFQKKLMAKYADYFWGCSQEANLSLFPKYLLTQEKSAIINNAIDVAAFHKVSTEEVNVLRSKFKLTENTIILGNIGRIVAHKNVSFVIDVLKELDKRNFDFVFVFAGRADQPTYLEQILRKVREFKIEDRVIYLDVREDIPVLMNCFDIFVAPALKEGFGMVAVEAQASGTPSLLYNGFPNSVDMGLGLVNFFDSFIIEDWAEAILSLPSKIEDKKYIHDVISSNGFDIKSNTEKIERLYKNHYMNKSIL
jgi:glycosyltransferase EpsF